MWLKTVTRFDNLSHSPSKYHDYFAMNANCIIMQVRLHKSGTITFISLTKQTVNWHVQSFEKSLSVFAAINLLPKILVFGTRFANSFTRSSGKNWSNELAVTQNSYQLSKHVVASKLPPIVNIGVLFRTTDRINIDIIGYQTYDCWKWFYKIMNNKQLNLMKYTQVTAKDFSSWS